MQTTLRLLCLISLIVLLFPTAIAASSTTKEMKLLAVSQQRDGSLQGDIAQLKVEVVQGSGRIFIETYPLTKIDTQISARLAKQIACSFLKRDCGSYDFIYTIRSGSPTIGGPSAGAAIAALTVAALEDAKVHTDVTITGTIGSGGLVGPVGGIKEKIAAASTSGITTVMIPQGESSKLLEPLITVRNATEITINRSDNESTDIDIIGTDLIAYGKELGVTVKEVSTLTEVINTLTDLSFDEPDASVTPPQYYDDIMSSLARELCERAQQKQLIAKAISTHLLSEQNKTMDTHRTNRTSESASPGLNTSNATATVPISGQEFIDQGENLIANGASALTNELYYAAASYCFGAGLQYNYLIWLDKAKDDLMPEIEIIQESITDFRVPEPTTIPRLQAYMLVKERVDEAQNYLDNAYQDLIDNSTRSARLNAAYAQERLFSAMSWSKFFDAPGQEFTHRDQMLKEACALRIQEAQERQQYVTIYLPSSQIDYTDLDQAFLAQDNREYPMCIFEASKAKAYYDIVMGAIGAQEEQLREQLSQRSRIANRQIAQQFEQGIFPIAAYSYVEYGNALARDDLFSGLLYVQYGIELSNIQIYLDGELYNNHQVSIYSLLASNTLEVFLAGVAIGLLLAVVMVRIERFLRRETTTGKPATTTRTPSNKRSKQQTKESSKRATKRRIRPRARK